MDNGSQVALTLKRMPQGGYLVVDDYEYPSGIVRQMHFACSDIDVALKFMRDAILPVVLTKKPE